MQEEIEMKICFLACGIFELELEHTLAEIRKENLFDAELVATYLQSSLHVDLKKLKDVILNGLDNIASDRIILLYGSKCHNEFHEFLRDYQITRFPQSNCIELILGDKMKEIDQTSNTFCLTPGWLNKWREIFSSEWGLDEVALRQNFGYYDRVLLIDTGLCELSDEKILDFFDHTHVPIEVEQVGLEVFKNNIMSAIRQAML